MGSKAIAGSGTIPLGSALVSVGLWAFGLTPPQEIVLARQAILSVPLAWAAIYFMPAEAKP